MWGKCDQPSHNCVEPTGEGQLSRWRVPVSEGESAVTCNSQWASSSRRRVVSVPPFPPPLPPRPAASPASLPAACGAGHHTTLIQIPTRASCACAKTTVPASTLTRHASPAGPREHRVRGSHRPLTLRALRGSSGARRPGSPPAGGCVRPPLLRPFSAESGPAEGALGPLPAARRHPPPRPLRALRGRPPAARGCQLSKDDGVVGVRVAVRSALAGWLAGWLAGGSRSRLPTQHGGRGGRRRRGAPACVVASPRSGTCGCGGGVWARHLCAHGRGVWGRACQPECSPRRQPRGLEHDALAARAALQRQVGGCCLRQASGRRSAAVRTGWPWPLSERAK
eukprot:scaffold443_cov527-Prasinococcus_capsulatus_cf.AAC.23